MAISVNGNTIYIPDSTSDEAVTLSANTGIKVVYILVTPTAASAELDLTDDDDDKTSKINLRWSSDSETRPYSFEANPLLFPNGIRATTTNCIVTLVFKR